MSALQKFKQDVEEMLKTMTPEELRKDLETFGVIFERPKIAFFKPDPQLNIVVVSANVEMQVEYIDGESADWEEKLGKYPFNIVNFG